MPPGGMHVLLEKLYFVSHTPERQSALPPQAAPSFSLLAFLQWFCVQLLLLQWLLWLQ